MKKGGGEGGLIGDGVGMGIVGVRGGGMGGVGGERGGERGGVGKDRKAGVLDMIREETYIQTILRLFKIPKGIYKRFRSQQRLPAVVSRRCPLLFSNLSCRRR